MTPIRLFLVDDHSIVREGLAAVLAHEHDFEIAGVASDAHEALEALEETTADVIVLDQRLRGVDGLALCREIAERRLDGRIVMLSGFIEDASARAAFLAGASAYVVKDVETAELKRAIRAVARGESTVDPKIAGRFQGWASNLTPSDRPERPERVRNQDISDEPTHPNRVNLGA